MSVGLIAVAPAKPLQPYVQGYWCVQDLAGIHEGQPIRTSAHAGAVFSVNIGRPNAMVGGPLVPRVSLLGVQTAARDWRSWSETYFVMTILTLQGAARLFPHTGTAAANTLLDFAAIDGDTRSNALADEVSAAWTPEHIASVLDHWFLDRLARMSLSKEPALVSAAHRLLSADVNVQSASAHTA